MVRSLVIRQAFRVLDITLTLAVIAVVVVVLRMFLTPLLPLEPGVAVEDAGSVELATVLKTVGDRRSYDSLVKGGLFGNASDWDPAAAPPVEEPPAVEESAAIEESELGLALRGTIALESGKEFAAALIENTEKREKPHPYKIDQEVLEGIVLVDIAQREVILLNKRQEPYRKERLSMQGGELQLTGGTGARPRGAAVVSASGEAVYDQGSSRGNQARGQGSTGASSSSSVQRMAVKRDEIIREAIQNYSSLATITPEVKTDPSGKVLGLTAENIEAQPLAKKLGFRDGDVLQSVNNEEITSREQLYDLFQRYQTATSFRVGILRDGRPMVLNFQVD